MRTVLSCRHASASRASEGVTRRGRTAFLVGRRVWAALAAWACASYALPASAENAVLHVFGPEGTGRERRALLVLESPDGGCVSLDDATVGSDEEGTAVAFEAEAGPCVRWARVSSESSREYVTVRVNADGLAAAAAVAMGGERGLSVRATRTGRSIAVRVANVPEGEPVRVVAFWSGGSAELEPRRAGRFVGSVPADELVGIVARSGNLAGAAVVAPRGSSGQASAVVMPSELAVEAGGAARTAAFLAVSNRRGRLSRAVPLNITSERGSLHRMRWLSRGLAAIELSAPTGTESIDLAVSVRGALATELELPVVSAWPSSAELESPSATDVGEAVTVAARGLSVDGVALPMTALRIDCAGSLVEVDAEGSGTCAWSEDGERRIVAGAFIDGRLVPLVHREIVVRAPRTPPGLDGPTPSEPEPEGPLPVEPDVAGSRVLWAGATLAGGLDLKVRGNVRAGGRLEVALWRWLRFAVDVSYNATIIHATASDERVVPDGATGAQHGVDLLPGLAVVHYFRNVALVARLGLGPSYCFSDVTLRTELDGGSLDRNDGGSDSDVRLVGMAAIGVRIPAGPVQVGIELLGRGAMVETANSYGAAPFFGFLELSVGGRAGGE